MNLGSFRYSYYGGGGGAYQKDGLRAAFIAVEVIGEVRPRGDAELARA